MKQLQTLVLLQTMDVTISSGYGNPISLEIVDYLNVLEKLLLRLILTLRINLQWVVVLLQIVIIISIP